ncbi:MAG: DUF2723 domain-containing protein [Candidatus Coatesbacteria bacterium]|nr:DUF2723 domain-containing protein [Candidatus Coatesbacteria bacterium]
MSSPFVRNIYKTYSEIILLAILSFTLFLSIFLKAQWIVDWVDSGELAVDAYRYVQAHPTGYPLYINITAPLSRIMDPIKAQVFLSIIFTVLTFLVFYMLIRVIFPKLEVLYSIMFAFSLSTGYELIKQSRQNEVYSLTAFLSILIILFLIKSYENKKFLFLLSYTAGLSLGNHMLIFTIVIPILLYLLFRKIKSRNYSHLFLIVFFFSLGISIYLFLPIRSTFNIFLNWGKPDNMTNFYRHISGYQYRVWMFNDFSIILPNLKKIILSLISEHSYLNIFLTIIGFYFLFKKDKKLFSILIICLLISVFYIVNYIIPDIEGYYLIPFTLINILSIFGVGFIYKRIKNKIAIMSLFVLVFFLSIVRIISPYPINKIAYETQININKGLPYKTHLFTNNWDYCSPALYHQEVKSIRPDVIWIDIELMRRTWYINHLAELLEPINSNHLDPFIKELNKFENNTLKDARMIQIEFVGIQRDIISYYSQSSYVNSLIPPGYDLDEKQIFGAFKRNPSSCTWAINSKTLPGFLDPKYLKWTYDKSRLTKRDFIAIKIIAMPWYIQAEDFLASELWKPAEACFTSIINMGLEEARSLGGLSYSLYRQGRFAEAKESLSRIRDKGDYEKQINQLENALNQIK